MSPCPRLYSIAFTRTHLFNDPLSGTTQVSRYRKGKTNLDFTEARDSEWRWHQLGCMLVCTSLQTDNHASTPPLIFLQAGCHSRCPTKSVKALKTTVVEELSGDCCRCSVPSARCALRRTEAVITCSAPSANMTSAGCASEVCSYKLPPSIFSLHYEPTHTPV